MKKIKGFYFSRGVHVPDRKTTASLPIENMPAPEIASLSVSMALGKPATPVVAVGDKVKVGQLIAEASGPISGNVHSSVSGEVVAISSAPNATGGTETYIDIRNDGNDETAFLEPLGSDATREQLIARARDAGIVGMGGAGFPTAVKLSPRTPVDTLVINGAECEPYLTCDCRLMLEQTDEIVRGARYFAKALGIDNIVIGIEANKPECISAFEKYDDVKVVELKKQYPMGGEKQLIYCTTKRKVPAGKLPADAGCDVQNVATCLAMCEAVEKGKPLIERVMTVAGNGVENPKNVRVRLGTSLVSVVNFCGGAKENVVKLVSGGPMMGFGMFDLHVPTTKTASALLCLTKDDVSEMEPTACIKCGRCVEVCPQRLVPNKLMVASIHDDAETFLKLNGLECVECGCCSYICPAKRPLTQSIKSMRKMELAKKKK